MHDTSILRITRRFAPIRCTHTHHKHLIACNVTYKLSVAYGYSSCVRQVALLLASIYHLDSGICSCQYQGFWCNLGKQTIRPNDQIPKPTARKESIQSVLRHTSQLGDPALLHVGRQQAPFDLTRIRGSPDQ